MLRTGEVFELVWSYGHPPWLQASPAGAAQGGPEHVGRDAAAGRAGAAARGAGRPDEAAPAGARAPGGAQDPGAQEAEGGDQQTGGAGEAEIGGRQSTSGVILLEFIIIVIVKLLLLRLVGELFVLRPQRQQLRPGPALLRPDGRSKLLLKPDNCVWPKTRSFRPRVSSNLQRLIANKLP